MPIIGDLNEIDSILRVANTPVSEFYCTEKGCSSRGVGYELEWRDCGNRACCKEVGTHYPICLICGKVMTEVTNAPAVIWTGNIGKRYRDPTKEGYHGDSTGEDGFWAWTRNTPDKKPAPVRIETWQQARDFAKANGCADPREISSNAEVSDDGRKLMTAGMSGQEI